jgi:hypothetical protein
MTKVENMTSANGNKIANQFIITEDENEMSGNAIQYFQSYNTIIAKRDKFRAGIAKRAITLDFAKWDYSKTTSKYRNQFLGETTKETAAKIKSGEYTLANLN